MPQNSAARQVKQRFRRGMAYGTACFSPLKTSETNMQKLNGQTSATKPLNRGTRGNSPTPNHHFKQDMSGRLEPGYSLPNASETWRSSILLSIARLKSARLNICCSNAASISATRRCGSGGTASAQCSHRRSESAEPKTICILAGASTRTRCLCGSTERHITFGVPLIMRARS